MSRAFLLCAALCLGAAAAYGEDHAALERRMLAALAQHPDDLEARFQLARALSWQKRYAEAGAQFRRLLAARPNNADFLLGLAQVRLWRGDAERALPLLQKARRLTPQYEAVWRVEIQALLAHGSARRTEQARRLRAQAQRRFPRSDWTFAQLEAPAAAAAVPVDTAAPLAPPAVRASEPPARTGASATVAVAAAVPSPAPRVDSQVALQHYAWEAGAARESLDKGLPAWSERHLLGEWRTSAGARIYGGLRQTERYALTDNEAHAGAALPAGAGTQVQFELGASDSHRVLPAHYLLAQLSYQPAQGWALAAGLRRSIYAAGPSSVAHFSVDRYLANERFGYTLYEGGPDGSGLAPSHRLQWAHHYSERDWAGIAATRGRESENTGAAGFLTAQVSGLALTGSHSLAAEWAVVWSATRLRQGSYYTRTGVSLGLRHAF